MRRESQVAAGLSDPHVVPIHGFGEIDGRLCLMVKMSAGALEVAGEVFDQQP